MAIDRCAACGAANVVDALATWVDSGAGVLSEYGLGGTQIRAFLRMEASDTSRREEAVAVVETILAAQAKKMLAQPLAELARVEPPTLALNDRARDHVSHAVLTYVLGCYLNEYFMPEGLRVHQFQWKIAGLLHDIAYPIQIAFSGLVQPFAEVVHKIQGDIGPDRANVEFLVDIRNLEQLANGVNSFNLLQARIKEWGHDIDATAAFSQKQRLGDVCHGMLSALVVLRIIDQLYDRHNPAREEKEICVPGTSVSVNEKYFREDVVPACAAIFLHNLDAPLFRDVKIDRNRAPLAFLLKLADTLQDWGRPTEKCPHGLDPHRYCLQVQPGSLNYLVPIERVAEVRAEIYSVLAASDVRIEGNCAGAYGRQD